MPDLYLRESQVLALEFQERTLQFLREGNDIQPLITAPLGESGVIPPPATQSAQEKVDDSDLSSSSDSSSEPESTEVPELTCAIFTLASNRIHRAVKAPKDFGGPTVEGFRPSCSRRVLAASVYSGRALYARVHDSSCSWLACELCFPRTSGKTCPMVCGAWLRTGICAARCCGTSATDCQIDGHRCMAHKDNGGFDPSSAGGSDAEGSLFPGSPTPSI